MILFAILSHAIVFSLIAASNLLSWSYQSTNPCTVLVKEKHDNVQENSPLSASTNRPRPSVEHSQQSSVSSIEPNDSGGTNGGKHRARRSLQVDKSFVDVVGIEDVVSNSKSTDNNDTNNQLNHEFKRILVNISIATDEGLGTHNLQVYQLQVAVPLPTINVTKSSEASDSLNHDQNNDNNFYAYSIDDNAMELIQRPIEWQAGNLMFKHGDGEITTTTDSSLSVTSSTDEMQTDQTEQQDTTTMDIMTASNEWLVSGSYEENEMNSMIMTSTTGQSINMSQSFPPHYIELPKGERH